LYTKNFLVNFRQKALRRGLWFRTLDSLDRGFFNLTCIIVDRIESETLLREILGIVLKLRDALKGEFVRLVESLGVGRTWRASENATLWGYSDAHCWRWDMEFARFHAVIEHNDPSGWDI
jgi:hypothetical protein